MRKHDQRIVFTIGVLVVSVICGGCGGGSRQAVYTDLVPFTPEDHALWESTKKTEYRLKIGDTFSVDFKYQNELDQRNIIVLPDGRFTMAGLGGMRAAGMTISELDSSITQYFSKDYVNPELSVVIEKLSADQVYVLGEVERPGLYELPPGGGGVLQAVASAGGFTDDAQDANAVLMRVTPEGYLFRRMDLSHLEKRGILNVELLDVQPFDVIYVPRSQIGDLAYFNRTVLATALSFSRLFLDIYWLGNITTVDRGVR
jgi:protein involved in polysaccharide export with SLBB domain